MNMFTHQLTLVHISKAIPNGIPEVQNIESCTINPVKDDTGNEFEAHKVISGNRTLVMIKLNDWKDSKEGK